jgi:hypothetical protein
MVIVDAQIHIWAKGTPSPHPDRSRTPRTRRLRAWTPPALTAR